MTVNKSSKFQLRHNLDGSDIHSSDVLCKLDEDPLHLLTNNDSLVGASTNGINHSADLKSVELTGSANSVCTHVLKLEPVANLDIAWEHKSFGDTINGITSRSPDACQLFIGKRGGRVR